MNYKCLKNRACGAHHLILITGEFYNVFPGPKNDLSIINIFIKIIMFSRGLLTEIPLLLSVSRGLQIDHYMTSVFFKVSGIPVIFRRLRRR